MVERVAEARPAWPLRLPMRGGDGVLRRSGATLERLLHVDGEPAIVRAARPGRDRVVIAARAARADIAEEAIGRMRFALGVDDDLSDFYERYRFDPLIGPSLRARPHLRPQRRPEPFEALAWAITEQLIELSRAHEIQRRIVWRLGRRCAQTGLVDLPDAARLAGTAPALLESFGLAGRRALALRRAAQAVARGGVDLRDSDHERTWRLLRAIPGVGAWTVEMLALHGQGRFDQVPAGDVNLLKLVGRLRSGGNPRERAEEGDVRELFGRYGRWAGLAALHAMSWGWRGQAPAPAQRLRPVTGLA